MPGPYSTDEAPNSWEDITTYNNFYEFGTDKEDPYRNAQEFRTRPWTVKVSGECGKPGRYDYDDILRPHALEDRVYRHRCVEAWSMVVPWVGFPLGDLLRRFEPNADAKYVAFKTLFDPEQMPGQRRAILRWPYEEGLTMDEAMHPLTLMAVGVYGKELPNQYTALRYFTCLRKKEISILYIPSSVEADTFINTKFDILIDINFEKIFPLVYVSSLSRASFKVGLFYNESDTSVFDLMMELKEQFDLTYLFITHDLATAKYVCNRIAIMYLGKFCEVGPLDEVYKNSGHPYTHALLEAVPVPDPKHRHTEAMPAGEIPSAINPPSGCRFHPRCPIARPNCAVEVPLLRELRPQHSIACHYAEDLLK